MRNALIILFLFISSVVGATTYYIDPSGNNSNNGAAGSPWKTLAYACTKATVSGDIIHVNAGVYAETTQSVLAPGVSIEGVGNTSIIRSSISTSYIYTILLSSSSEGTNGNQSISNIRMEGGMVAYGAILVEKRKNVNIHHCEFQDFVLNGIWFIGAAKGTDAVPSVYATGNLFHDNKVTNCAGYVGSGPYGAGQGNLCIGGQQGMLVYNNTIIQTDRGAGKNGFCIKYAEQGYNKGLKIYNNTITKPPYDGITWDFSIELWNCRGGIEIYNNNIQGCIDFGGNTSITNDAGGYGFAARVYNNVLGQSSLRSTEENGLDIERGQTGGFYVYNNLFKNLTAAIIMYQGNADVFKDLYVYYNVFNNIGATGQANYGNGINWGTIDNNNITYDNINFINNTIYAGTGGNPQSGLRFDFRGNATNITLKNNIIHGFKAYPIYMQATGTISNVSVENNLYYANGINAASYATTVTNKTERNNRVGNPNFVSPGINFHLTSGSVDAINYGVRVTTPSILTDFDGAAIGTVPDIGAFEFGSSAAATSIPVYQSSVVENATPSILSMTYDLTLNNLSVPAATSFSVVVNTVARPVSTVSISGSKVLLTLSSAVKYGDNVTVAYTKPATNPLQTTAGGAAISISARTIINNLSSPAKDGIPITIKMTISPNHIHKIMNVLLEYTGSLTTYASVITPQILRVTDLTGKVFIEQLLVTGISNIKIPLNLSSGIYTVLMLAGGVEMTSQKMIVY